MTDTLIVTIGRNVESVPMNSKMWYSFRGDIDRSLLEFGEAANIDIIDFSRFEGINSWQNRFEESYTAHVVFDAELEDEKCVDALIKFYEAVQSHAAFYGQDAIAVCQGTTQLTQPS